MPDYVPVYVPGQARSHTTSSAVTGGRLVAVSGNGTVATAPAASKACVGVAAFDVPSGARLTVHSGGVQELVAAGAVTAGDAVICGASGAVASSATPPAGQQVGVALGTAADGALVRVQMER